MKKYLALSLMAFLFVINPVFSSELNLENPPVGTLCVTGTANGCTGTACYNFDTGYLWVSANCGGVTITYNEHFGRLALEPNNNETVDEAEMVILVLKDKGFKDKKELVTTLAKELFKKMEKEETKK